MALPAGQSHHGGQGISRKPDDEPTVREFGQNSWVTWAHGDAVQQQSPTERGHGATEVVGAGWAGSACRYVDVRLLPGECLGTSQGR